MLKTSVYIATSLDGYIARTDGNLDWLPTPDPSVSGEDYGYEAFMASVDVLLMGRRTFEKVLTFGDWPYSGHRVVVLTSRPLQLPEGFAGAVTTLSGTPGQILASLDSSGLHHAYVDGGETITRFLRVGAIDRIIVARIPVLIGSGIPLFGSLAADVDLVHVATRSWPSGIVQSEYRVLRPAVT